MGTALDPGGLEAGTREVYWWAADQLVRGGDWSEQQDAAVRGSQPTPYRAALLDAWALAGVHDHARLRLAHAEYAGPMLMWQAGGIARVRELLDAIEADLADIREARTARRATFEPVRRG